MQQSMPSYAPPTHPLHARPNALAKACGGRTYRYWQGPVLYPFGHGLSYTSFSLDWTPTPPPAGPTVFSSAEATQTYSVVVTNTGFRYAADEVVLAFFKVLHCVLQG
jgi:hypothetical protein